MVSSVHRDIHWSQCKTWSLEECMPVFRALLHERNQFGKWTLGSSKLEVATQDHFRSNCKQG